MPFKVDRSLNTSDLFLSGSHNSAVDWCIPVHEDELSELIQQLQKMESSIKKELKAKKLKEMRDKRDLLRKTIEELDKEHTDLCGQIYHLENEEDYEE